MEFWRWITIPPLKRDCTANLRNSKIVPCRRKDQLIVYCVTCTEPFATTHVLPQRGRGMEKASVPFLLGDLLSAHFNASLNEPLPETLVLLIEQLRCSSMSMARSSTSIFPQRRHLHCGHLSRWA